ncbi:YicC/YloC family endoribonuclease [Yoonia sp. SS1-5]|uniref:YicC/YloC family endoribonuclease n=1 Tax=Yoonia rhodophyticola TaxID=3137370 RepID=A0AAN0M814_9RHOB
MIQSMTAFTSRTGTQDDVTWAWDMRSVNARGFDLRLRLPDGIEGLEAALRSALKAALARGNVTVNLRVTKDEGAQALSLDQTQLDAVLQALDAVQNRAFEIGVTLAQPTAADVLAHRGVMVAGKPDDDGAALAAAMIGDVPHLVADLIRMRQEEGAALHDVITAQVDQIANLTQQAAAAAAARLPQIKENLTAALRRVVDDVAEVEEARVAQELALLAAKADVTEEIDRLQTHVKAAYALLAQDAPAGRKLDFLAQEFNREANTLCSKAQSPALTAIGLDLKAVIDQMREQIQNVE